MVRVIGAVYVLSMEDGGRLRTNSLWGSPNRYLILFERVE